MSTNAAPENANMPAGAPPEEDSTLARLEGRLDDVAQRFDKTDWVELVAAIVLAFATILAAWSAYQSSRWGGEQAKATSEANASRQLAASLLGVLQTQVLVDNQIFVAWTQSAVAGDEAGMAAFEAQVREEARPAFQAWLDTAPEGGLPQGTASDLPEYDEAMAQAVDAATTASEATEAALARAGDANQRSDNFVLAAVIMASVLFFAGVGSKFRNRTLRTIMVLLSVLILLLGFGFIVSMPQNVGL